ncbi:hypothetical protein PoB_001492000 [Plakobranchus ocellatus]|uniref:Uncharacterized protein n=1 Tax=Plakobranchus ocellatus TaxID=259542 RepID=A0AAV3YYZ7_9GAST|nr:hypothetical protein PoB_001492000 [Plakobranchus ocellatus]
MKKPEWHGRERVETGSKVCTTLGTSVGETVLILLGKQHSETVSVCFPRRFYHNPSLMFGGDRVQKKIRYPRRRIKLGVLNVIAKIPAAQPLTSH